jgi:hypothetical protein
VKTKDGLQTGRFLRPPMRRCRRAYRMVEGTGIGAADSATLRNLIGFHSQLVPESSLMKGGLPCPRCKIFPAWATGPNRRDAPRQAPYFLSRRRQKVSKKRLPLRGACARAGPVPRISLVVNQPRRGSVVTIAAPITGCFGRMLFCNSALRGQRLWLCRGF